MNWIKQTEKGVVLVLHIQPNAKKNAVVGEHGNALKIKIDAPPQDGKANKELVRFLAKKLGVSKSDIEILTGSTSRTKHILVKGINALQIKNLLMSERNAK